MSGGTSGPDGAVVRDGFSQYEVDIGAASGQVTAGSTGVCGAIEVKIVGVGDCQEVFDDGILVISCYDVLFQKYYQGASESAQHRRHSRTTCARGLVGRVAAHRRTARDCGTFAGRSPHAQRSPAKYDHVDSIGQGWPVVDGKSNAFLQPVFASCRAFRPAGDGRISARTAR